MGCRSGGPHVVKNRKRGRGERVPSARACLDSPDGNPATGRRMGGKGRGEAYSRASVMSVSVGDKSKSKATRTVSASTKPVDFGGKLVGISQWRNIMCGTCIRAGMAAGTHTNIHRHRHRHRHGHRHRHRHRHRSKLWHASSERMEGETLTVGGVFKKHCVLFARFPLVS